VKRCSKMAMQQDDHPQDIEEDVQVAFQTMLNRINAMQSIIEEQQVMVNNLNRVINSSSINERNQQPPAAEMVQAERDSFLIKDGTLDVKHRSKETNFHVWFKTYETETLSKGWNSKDRLSRLKLFADNEMKCFIEEAEIKQRARGEISYDGIKAELFTMFNQDDGLEGEEAKMQQKEYACYARFRDYVSEKVADLKTLNRSTPDILKFLKKGLPLYMKEKLRPIDNIPDFLSKGMKFEEKHAIACEICGHLTHPAQRCPNTVERLRERMQKASLVHKPVVAAPKPQTQPQNRPYNSLFGGVQRNYNNSQQQAQQTGFRPNYPQNNSYPRPAFNQNNSSQQSNVNRPATQSNTASQFWQQYPQYQRYQHIPPQTPRPALPATNQQQNNTMRPQSNYPTTSGTQHNAQNAIRPSTVPASNAQTGANRGRPAGQRNYQKDYGKSDRVLRSQNHTNMIQQEQEPVTEADCADYGYAYEEEVTEQYEAEEPRLECDEEFVEPAENEQQEQSEYNTDADASSFAIRQTEYSRSTPVTTVLINDIPIQVLIDSGSEVSVITHDKIKELNLYLYPYRGPKLHSAGMNTLKPIGEVRVKLELGDSEKNIALVVVENLPSAIKCLLGCNSFTENQHLNHHMNKFHHIQCMSTNTSAQELIQLKEDGLHFIIYCPFSKIQIMNMEEECPDFPFRLSKQDNFTVGTFGYIGRAIEIKDRLDLTVQLKERINKHVPTTRLVQRSTSEMENTQHPSYTWPAVLFSCVTLVINIVITLFATWKQNRKLEQRSENQTEIEMKERGIKRKSPIDEDSLITKPLAKQVNFKKFSVPSKSMN